MKKESQNLLIEMGKRIVAKRNELGLSQETLAELAGISPKTISSAELGQKALRPENLIAVSRALASLIVETVLGVVAVHAFAVHIFLCLLPVLD